MSRAMAISSFLGSPRICAPTTLCVSTIRRSSAVSFPGLSRIESGTAILPMSCIGLAWRIISTCSAPSPSVSNIRALRPLMRLMCLAVPLSRNSAATLSRMMVSSRASISSSISSALWTFTAARVASDVRAAESLSGNGTRPPAGSRRLISSSTPTTSPSGQVSGRARMLAVV